MMMPDSQLPPSLQAVFEQSDPARVLSDLLPALGESLGCDRCFVYLRDPATRFGKVPFCWRRTERFDLIQDPDWKLEPASLPDEDPLFAAALRIEPTIYVEDMQTVSSEVANAQFEQENFGHRALIHAPLHQVGQLWGILEPCVFDHPRTWSDQDRAMVTEVEQRLTPVAIAYVKANYYPNATRSSSSA